MVTESSPMTPDRDAHIHEQMARWTVPGVAVGRPPLRPCRG